MARLETQRFVDPHRSRGPAGRRAVPDVCVYISNDGFLRCRGVETRRYERKLEICSAEMVVGLLLDSSLRAAAE